MEVQVNQLDFLKGVQALQSEAASRKMLNNLTHLKIESLDEKTIQLSVGGADFLWDYHYLVTAKITKPGVVTVSLGQLTEFLGSTNQLRFSRSQSGVVSITDGQQVIALEAIVSSSFSHHSFLHRLFRTSPAVLISLLLHLILAVYIALNLRNQIIEEDKISAEFVTMPNTSARRMIKKPVVDRIQRRVTPDPSLRLTDQPKIHITSPTNVAETIQRRAVDIKQNVDLNPKLFDQQPTDITTQTRLPMTLDQHRIQAPSGATSSIPLAGAGTLSNRVRAQSQGRLDSKGIASMLYSTGAEKSGTTSNFQFRDIVTITDDKLGAKIVGSGNEFVAHIKLVRLKHSLSDWWQDPTAVPSFISWLQDQTKITADVSFEGGTLPMTDERILDAPLIFMTGHDKDIVLSRSLAKDGPLVEGFSREERIALRRYLINRGGLLFFDDCGFNGNFTSLFRRELQSVLPEFQLENIPHDHELYRTYYKLSEPPTGGDVFWGGGYQPKPTQFKFQKGIFIGKRLTVVVNRKDYLCCMETSEVDSRAQLQDRRSPDVHRFMTNLLVYTMKYGGNTDRSEYKR